MKKHIQSLGAFLVILIAVFLSTRYSTDYNGETVNPPNGALQLYAKDGYLDVPLISRKAISPDTYVFEFGLPDENISLGLEVGQHVVVHATLPTKSNPEGEEIMRKYTPTSRTNQTGTFELMIKIYRPGSHPVYPEGGVMTPYIENLKIGDKIKISGPRGKLVYHGYGDINIDMPERKQKMKAKRIGLIAGGSGIAPMYQVIQAVLDDPRDDTRVSLLFGNRSEEDILLRDRLEEAAKDPRIDVYFAVNKGDDRWKGFEGHLTKDMITRTMPNIGDDVLICICGPKGFNQMLTDYLAELGYGADHVFKF